MRRIGFSIVTAFVSLIVLTMLGSALLLSFQMTLDGWDGFRNYQGPRLGELATALFFGTVVVVSAISILICLWATVGCLLMGKCPSGEDAKLCPKCGEEKKEKRCQTLSNGLW